MVGSLMASLYTVQHNAARCGHTYHLLRFEYMMSGFVHASYIVASVINVLLYLMLNTEINRILKGINVG
jgi:hypothetical protein